MSNLTPASAALLFLFLGSALAAQGGTAPPSFTENWGTSRFPLPWDRTTSRSQFLFERAGLPATLTPAKPVTAFGWRRFVGSTSLAGTVDTEVFAYSSQVTRATFSPTFANNRSGGIGGKCFMRKIVNLPPQTQASSAFLSPANSFMLLTLDTPHVFLGPSLLLEVVNYGGSTGLGWASDCCGGAGAAADWFGTPCGPTQNVITGFVSGGNATVIEISGPANAPAALILGASASSYLGLPLPLDLGIIFMPGCKLYASMDLTVPTGLDNSGYASRNFPIGGLVGSVTFTAQWAHIDPTANSTGVSTSNAMRFETATPSCPMAFTSRGFDNLDTTGTAVGSGSGPVVRIVY